MKKAASWIPPEWLEQEAWEEYESYRKQLKNPWTDKAKTLAANKLRGLNKEAQKQTINRTIESGWVGLFPDKSNDSDGRNFSAQPYKQERMSDAEWRKRQKVALEKLRELRRKL